MEYWVISTGDYALWYYDADGMIYWVIGPSDQVGTTSAYLFGDATAVPKECPVHDPWAWIFHDGTDWVETNDVSIACTGKIRNMLEVFV